MPVGGIGTGTVSVNGRGSLVDWEIMNIPGKGFSTVTPGNDAPFFAIYINDGEKSYTKGLMGPLLGYEYEHMEGRPVDHHGIPRFEKATFDAAYPFGIVNLSDQNLPVNVKIKVFNPLIPGDADASGIPIAVLRYEVENKTNKPLEVSVCGSIRNFIGKDGSKYRIDWKGDKIYEGAVKNQNRFRKEGKISGINFLPGKVDKDNPAWGTMALTTDASETVTYRTSSVPNAWANSVLDFWDDFSDDGKLVEKSALFDDDPMASLAIFRNIPAGGKEVFQFFLTWHFPNRKAWSSEVVGNYYTTQYTDAWDVIEKIYPKLNELEEKTLLFVSSFLSSDLPEVVKEAALFNVSTLRSQTVFRLSDGHMMGWEGCMDNFGSCAGSCTHVWNYEQATAFLFGDLAKTMRDNEFADKCAAIYASGSKWTDENLFNGEYYEHMVLDPATKEEITDYSAPNMPKYQLAKGCLVDQLVGQYMAHICGLGYLASEANIKTTLQSILKYNSMESMENHFNNMRSSLCPCDGFVGGKPCFVRLSLFGGKQINRIYCNPG